MTVKGIEVAGTIYDNEDETARSTATEADSTARAASQTATQASETATTASQTATQASETATQANGKATENAEAISQLQSDVETLDSKTVKKSDVTSSVAKGNTNPISSGGVFSKLGSFSAKNLRSGEAFTISGYGVANLEGFIQRVGAVKATLVATEVGEFSLIYDSASVAKSGITVSGTGWNPILTYDGVLIAYGLNVS